MLHHFQVKKLNAPAARKVCLNPNSMPGKVMPSIPWLVRIIIRFISRHLRTWCDDFMSNCSIGKQRHQSDVICITGLEIGYGIFSCIDINIHSSPVPKCLVVYLIPSHIGPKGWRSPGDLNTGGFHLLNSEVSGRINTCNSKQTVCICRSVSIILIYTHLPYLQQLSIQSCWCHARSRKKIGQISK